MAGSTSSLVLHAVALVLVYSLYSVLQEKIMKTAYGLNSDQHFTSASLLVLSNRFFSLATGLCFSIFLPRGGEAAAVYAGKDAATMTGSDRGGILDRLRPSWPIYSYAVVAAANFASTYCQYDALRFVGFTTQALAKCAKMVPVLLIGRLIYKRSYRTKEYIAGMVVLLGCFVYLSSRPTSSTLHHHHHEAKSSSSSNVGNKGSENDDNPLAPLIGGFLLCSYLFFDGLTSTTQEHYFGKSKKDIHPLTAGGPVLDQMVFVNLCATGISAVICAVNWKSTGPSLELAMGDQQLWFDITMLSATATFGLVILYDTIFKHGALTVATTMTLRQFFSILLNAGLFGNFAQIGFGGWAGVGFVAAGVWIKMDRRFDTPKSPSSSPSSTLPSSSTHAPNTTISITDPNAASEAKKEGLMARQDSTSTSTSLSSLAGVGVDQPLPLYATPELENANSLKRIVAQYGVPLTLPLVFAAVASIFI